MSNLDRHLALSDARTIITDAWAAQPVGTPADKKLKSAMKYIEQHMGILEGLMFAESPSDPGYCFECNLLCPNMEEHDESIHAEDTGEPNYPPQSVRYQ